MLDLGEKLKLYGFNNLTKALSFNIYDVCYAKTAREQKDYIDYIDEQYNSERLTKILCDVTETIGATVLNISKQDYNPQGASVNILIAEEHVPPEDIDVSCNQGKMFLPQHDTVHAHLDKSHVTVHTFPEFHPDNAISTFRVDIDVATCGEISPLNTLDYLIGSFDSDIITIDYRVRGFTRDVYGKKYFIDHDITSIQDYIDPHTLTEYDAIDMNVYQSNIFHTRMLIKERPLQNYLFNTDVYEIPPDAIRELIINAAVHRSYLDHGNIQVAIYDDRLEITSPGKLPMGQTLERMKEGYSQIRNEALASAFSYMNLIEHWGSGIPRIIGKVKAAGLREPVFIGGEVDLRINIYRNNSNSPDNSSYPDCVRDQSVLYNEISEECRRTAGEPPENRRKTAGELPRGEQEQKIYRYVLENAYITRAQVMTLLDLKQRRAREILFNMIEDGWLRKEGASRSTIYVLNTTEK